MSEPVTITLSAQEAITVTAATVGPQGPKGETGAAGADGGGVPPGGVVGQVLVKSGSEDFAAVWADVPQQEEIDGGTF